jgi:hypothetical protein
MMLTQVFPDRHWLLFPSISTFSRVPLFVIGFRCSSTKYIGARKFSSKPANAPKLGVYLELNLGMRILLGWAFTLKLFLNE